MLFISFLKAMLFYVILIEAGKHRLTKEAISQMLEAKDKHACRYKASANGLYLVRVDYQDNSSPMG